MKLFRFLGVLGFCVLSARADLPVRVVTTGLGVVVLAEPVSREALGEMLAKASAAPGEAAPALWLVWPDGVATALDMDVTRLLPAHLLKVYTMSSSSPVLALGERSGPASLAVRPVAPFAPGDWALQPGEPEEKAALARGLHARYAPAAAAAAAAAQLDYYDRPAAVLAERAAASAEPARTRAVVRDAQTVAAAPSAPPALRAGKPGLSSLALPIRLLTPDEKPRSLLLPAGAKDLLPLTRPVQIPLGNYNYDEATIAALDKPNELTVAEGRGIDLFALAEREFGAGSVAAVELICYNGFTSTLTAAGQGLLLVPPDGDLAAALAAGTALYAAYEEPVIIALRQPGQSPAEAASGVLAIHLLLR